MTTEHRFSDEDLTAFLDGEADDTLTADIADQLERDPDLADRLAALDIPLVPLAEAYNALLAEAPPMPELPEMTRPADPVRRTGWGWGVGGFATGIAAGLAVAAFVGFGAPPPAPAPSWAAFVASYQSLYTEATLRDVDPTPAETQAQLAAVSASLGLDVTDLPNADGLNFKRAQVLNFRGKPLVQIAYLRNDGTPVALCIIPAGPDEKPLNMGQAQGMDVARWNTPGYGFLLIGGADPAPLAAEADTFRKWSVGETI
ncbi:MAG: hypothetical protein AAFP87_00070 [Pseudomonadota bacterium]